MNQHETTKGSEVACASACYVYEIVDCSNDEIYYPMGIYLDEQQAIKELEDAEYHEAHYPEAEHVKMEVRRRKVGYSRDNYETVYEAVWEERESGETGDWEITRINLAQQQ